MPINHLQIHVADLEATRKFYSAALEPLGIKELYHYEGDVVGYGLPGKKPDIWLRQVKEGRSPSTRVHLAFNADNREQVEKFHEAALKAGAKDNGAAGERDYFPGYFAAFAFDPDGNNVEVVHLP